MFIKNLPIVKFSAILMTLVMFWFGVSNLVAQAAVTKLPSNLELNGYAWSSNIGWISLNCRTGGTGQSDICSTVNYQVKVNKSTGALTGYAWSSNIGWIKFGGLSGWPSGSDTYNGNARVTGTYPNLVLEGWARACAGTNAPDNSEQKNCSTMTINDNSGDWDGWISLKGTNYQINTEAFGTAQYAWGSEVVGWVDMSTYVIWSSQTTINATACEVQENESSCSNGTVSWTFSPDTALGRYIYRSSPSPVTVISNASLVGKDEPVTLYLGLNTLQALNKNNSVLASTAVTASCASSLKNVLGVCKIDDSSPTPVAIDSLTANPSLIRRGTNTTVSWEISAESAEVECTLSGPGVSNTSVTSQSGSRSVGPLTATAHITLTCGAETMSTTVNIVPIHTEV